MSTRKHTPRTRGFRPETNVLEDRQLLSAVVSGTDSKGDSWTLQLIGPGQLNVVKQDAPGTTTPAPLTSATDINTITIAGTDPETSKLIGKVTAAPTSDGRVFFQNLIEQPSRSEKFPGSGNGLVSIDMPNFWLGNTTPSGTTPTGTPSIQLPDGVETFDFGGVDTTFNPPTLTSSSTSDTTLIQMGLPTFGGSRIIINKAVSSSQVAPPATGSTTGTTINHGIVFAVAGRLDLFQANEIDGDPNNVPGQFKDVNSAATGSGGTTVISTSPGFGSTFAFTSNLFPNGSTKGSGITGQIGDVRIGGNATNFAAYAFDPTVSGGDKISNFSVGGETTNVQVVAPGGLRNAYFGKGMDTTELLAHVINNIQSNRGAVNSNVYSDRSISRVTLGGDVVNTKVLAGYAQNYVTILGDVIGDPALGQTPSAPPVPLNAQSFGGMTVHVAGNVTNSVFAASDQTFSLSSVTPSLSTFGNPNDILETGGQINGKIEGTVNNATIAPNQPSQAFFAAHVKKFTGPVVPPNVPEAPYSGPSQPTHLPGLPNANRALITVGASTPKGAVNTTKKA